MLTKYIKIMKKILTICICILMTTMSLFAQDIIVTKDAKKIDAKILEVSTSEVRYKELDNLEGPIFILRTDEINSIIYANGKVVIYNQPKSEEEQARERANRLEESRQNALREQNDIIDLERVRQEEEKARRQAAEEATAKANQMGSLFGTSGNNTGASGAGQIGCPVRHGSSGGNSWSLSGRAIKGTLPMPSNNFNQEGKVIVQIRVNPAGKVVEASIVGGNVSDKQTQQLALDAAKKAKFTEGEGDQVGTITYIFKLL